MGNTLKLLLIELWEHTAWQLHTAVEGANEGCNLDGVSQPRLPEDRVIASEDILDGLNFPSSNCTTDST